MVISQYVHRCIAGESFDRIAFLIYGDEKYAAELLCANPEYCETMVFSGGEILRLPVIMTQTETETGQTIETAPWRV